MFAGTSGGQGTDAAFGVGGVNGDHGKHEGSAIGLLPFDAISHAYADGNDLRCVLAPVGDWPVSKAYSQKRGTLPRSADMRELVQLFDLERGAQ